MSYTELEHGYQGLKNASRPMFYIGDINTVQPSVISSIYRSSKRPELSEGNQDDAYMGGSDVEGEGKQVLVGICAMAKKSQSKPMKEILTRLEEFEYIKIIVFPEEVILKEPVENWPVVDCLISFHSKGFPLDKAINYASLRKPFIINHLPMQYDIQDRRRVYAILESEGIEIPRYAVLDRDSPDPKQNIDCILEHELVESEDHVEVNGITFNKPFVEKPVSAEDHNIYIYYPTSAGGGSQRLFRKIGSRSSVYSPESRVRKSGSYIYEDFMPTDGTDVKVYTVGPDYAHAEARKSPALDGKVERDSEGKEIRYPVILNNAEKLISRKVCLAFKQTVCGFDLLRANGQSFVCDVNGFSFVKNSNKYYDDCAKILGNMILRELAPTLHIPWSVPFQLDDPPIVPTTFGKMMELRCVVAVIRHGDRTPKQKMKVEVRHPKFFEIFAKYDGYKHGHVKLKRPKQLQEILDTARSLLTEIQHRAAGPELEEKQGKLEQLKSVLEMYGHFSGINRKVQLKYQPRGRPRGSSSDDGSDLNRLGEPSLVLILKWGGELTPAGRIQAEELGRIFRCMYPGGQGRHLSEEESEMLPNHGEYAGAQGLGLLRLHSTFRHDLKIYASDEGRVQMTAAAFAKGLLALEGELTPILVQMVKSANTNGLLDNDCDSSKYQNMVKTRLHELLQQDREFTREDREQINPGNALSINAALDFVKNPVRCCQHVHSLIQKLLDIVRIKKEDAKTKDTILYHGETWELMGRRWGKIEKDFCTKNKRFDISKIPDIYDCIKYDLQHNNHTLQFEHAEELYTYAKSLADIVIPQEYGLTVQEKLTIGQGICTPLLKKIRADLQRNIEESEETVNRLNPRYSHGVSSPGRHVRTRLYFTSESHVHSLLTVLRYGGLLDVVKDEQWRRAMEYVSMVSELNYMSQIVVMLYEDPTKDPSSEERFHVELHFSPGVNCCVQKNLPPGPGFRPHSRNESSHNVGECGSGQDTSSQCSTRIEEEDAELGIIEDDVISPTAQAAKICFQDTPPPLMETDTVDSMLDSPTTSRGIDMMDLDPNMMDEPYDSGFLQGSAPIPISARTVAGHEAARLGSQLAASQRQRRSREAGSIVEPRARSYDHQRQEKPEKAADKLQYQSLDAVNKEAAGPTPEEPRGEERTWKPVTLLQSHSSPELPVSPDESFASSCSLRNARNDRQLSANPCSLPDPSFATVSGLPERTITRHRGRGRKYERSRSEVTLLPSVELYDSRSRIIQPDPTCTARRHRHSISGQMSYFKLLGYNVSKKLTGSANSLFSTAVISGSSSAPNLKDMVPPHASAVAAIEGFGGVPPIRPLETLHNALSLRQLDSFLDMMTRAPLYRTPASSPPKSSPAGSTHESLNPPLVHAGISREYHSSDTEAVRYIIPTPILYKPLGEAETCDTRNLPSPTSPNSTGWSSEPQSFLSEPSSPAPTSTGECSMSISLISNESAQLFIAPKFSPTCLDVDFNEFCIRLDQENRESRGSVSYTDYYSNEDGQIRKITQIPQVIQSGASGVQTKLVCGDDLPCDNIDEDEDHTLTLKQSEEQKKQDVKSIFEPRDDVNSAKLSGSYKKIGRFLVESTDISHGDVRIKDTDNAGTSDKTPTKLSTSQKSDSSSAGKSIAERVKKDSKKGGGLHIGSQKRKNFSRSQSVTTPKLVAPKTEQQTFSYSRQSSFSTMSDADLESWKLSADPTHSSGTSQQEEPILTVAGSLTDSCNVTVGFNIKEKEKK
ncbi:inositol hexakisphosphate and diphosphoinositol-pentakisphosphate kinase 2 isoform X1 [Temnothorax curvispinosus]|uniref:Inositol hexakisphosphate and diphosphoinositol-pentakisphosphate kinase n=1 Tax=Temnothorax curvispinosus TaxID=300111 RepID=A0A6J1QPZ0_9HYME|nr:inositol hexakisphosphate and diphosphoinositol-pentakisphosphate kinase 2 isoform X1 [Temnothorax curvispinosus]XP_024884535.1 inositol hexakisphosphate and diphosphoinositol-pentakisphosphate kinase 2 isoform X1 [Temnothorax curvispinosus]